MAAKLKTYLQMFNALHLESCSSALLHRTLKKNKLFISSIFLPRIFSAILVSNNYLCKSVSVILQNLSLTELGLTF